VDEIIFMIACLLAVAVIALTIFFCFKYSERIQKLLGQGGTDIAVRLFAFILFCLGVQILWSGGSELLKSVIHAAPLASASAEVEGRVPRSGVAQREQAAREARF
jgi:multiple antibiotic resistance protein